MEISNEQTKAPKKSKSTRKSFSDDVKAEALEMLKVATLKSTADFYGCSVAALQQWKAKYKSAKKGKTARSVKKSRYVKKTRPVTGAVSRTKIADTAAYERFVREYWQQSGKVDNGTFTISFDVFFATNEALRYAYEHFNK